MKILLDFQGYRDSEGFSVFGAYYQVRDGVAYRIESYTVLLSWLVWLINFTIGSEYKKKEE